MKQNMIHAGTAATFVISLLTAAATFAAPNETALCMRTVITQYNDSQTAALMCHDQLEADISEGLIIGDPLSPIEIQGRSEMCDRLEMTKEQRKTAMAACHQKPSQ